MKYTAKTLVLPFLALIPTAGLADWNGPYAGGAIGTLSADAEFELAAVPEVSFSDSSSFGGFAGFQVQTGMLVYGGEAAFSIAPSAELQEGEELQSFTDIKGRLGYSFGEVLAYGVAGVSFATYNETGTDMGIDFDDDFNGTGLNFGAGVDYKVTDNIFVGAEYLVRRTTGDYPNDDAEFDLDVDTFSVRVGFNF